MNVQVASDLEPIILPNGNRARAGYRDRFIFSDAFRPSAGNGDILVFGDTFRASPANRDVLIFADAFCATAIYLNVAGPEEREMAARFWKAL